VFLQILTKIRNMKFTEPYESLGRKIKGPIIFWMWVRHYATEKSRFVVEDLHVSSQAGRNHFCQSTLQQRGRPVSLLSEEHAEVTSLRRHFSSETGRSHFCQ